MIPTRKSITPAAIVKGELIGLTNGEKSLYILLKKHGIAFMQKSIKNISKKRLKLDKYLNRNKDVCKKVFTWLSKNKKTKMIADGEPNRFITATSDDDNNSSHN